MAYNTSLAGQAFMQFGMGSAEEKKKAATLATAVSNAVNKQNAGTQTTNTKNTTTNQRQTQKKSNFDDLFLEGFNSARDRDWREEQQSRMQKFGIGMSYESITQKKTPIQQPTSDKLTPEDEKAFLEGFNKYREDDKAEQAKLDKNVSVKSNDAVRTEDNPDLKEFGAESETYKILQDLGQRWMRGTDSEKEELHAVAQEVRRLARAGNRVRYGQDEITELLRKNAQTATDYQKTMTEGIPGFLYRMSDGDYMLDSATYLIGMTNKGDWDYKLNDYWRVPGDKYDGKNLNEFNHRNWLPWIYFDGKLIGADKLGNLNMSYVGKKMGLPEWVYSNPYTNDKDDAFWVQYGIDLANSGR